MTRGFIDRPEVAPVGLGLCPGLLPGVGFDVFAVSKRCYSLHFKKTDLTCFLPFIHPRFVGPGIHSLNKYLFSISCASCCFSCCEITSVSKTDKDASSRGDKTVSIIRTEIMGCVRRWSVLRRKAQVG